MHSKYTCKHRGEVCREDRERRNGHQATTFWFTGLSGAGKSTIAHAVEKRLFDENVSVYTFDGDNVRHGLCGDLGFSQEDRTENIRRISEMTKLFMDAGTVCLCAFITPQHDVQRQLRESQAEGDFYLIHVDCPVSVCEERDVKGYYKKAREGKIKNYTGINNPYEAPLNPDLHVDSDKETLEESVDKVLTFIWSKLSIS